MSPLRRLHVVPGRHPFEVALLAAFVIVGGVMVVTGIRPPSLQRGYAETVVTVWLACVAAGGLIGLLGVYWRGRPDDGLLVEALGVGAIAAACLLYVVGLWVTQPIGGAFTAGGFLTGIGAGGTWRLVQCVNGWRKIRAALAGMSVDAEPRVEDNGGST